MMDGDDDIWDDGIWDDDIWDDDIESSYDGAVAVAVAVRVPAREISSGAAAIAVPCEPSDVLSTLDSDSIPVAAARLEPIAAHDAIGELLIRPDPHPPDEHGVRETWERARTRARARHQSGAASSNRGERRPDMSTLRRRLILRLGLVVMCSVPLGLVVMCSVPGPSHPIDWPAFTTVPSSTSQPSESPTASFLRTPAY